MIYGGPLKSDPRGDSENQSFRFPARRFTPAEARAWLAKNKIKIKSFEKATG